jgi:hypothetical protein
MIEFLYHDGLQKEIAALERRFRQLRDGFQRFELLCQVQFNPTDPKQIIAPAKLHRVTQNDLWTMWKIELVVPNSGLRPNQYPRVWFAIRGAVVAFLCMGTHMDNYNDAEMDQLALTRITDLF